MHALLLGPAMSCMLVPSCPHPTHRHHSLVDQLTSQHTEELGIVQCGQPFALEVEALDSFNNRRV